MASLFIWSQPDWKYLGHINTKSFFAEYRQYQLVPEQKPAIFDSWEEIEENASNKPNSIETRIFECIQHNVGITDSLLVFFLNKIKQEKLIFF